MKHIITIILLLTAFTSFAQQGNRGTIKVQGDGTDWEAKELVHNTKVIRVNEIYTMGNSITANGGYQSKLLSLLDSTWAITNFGISGNLTTDMLLRFNQIIRGKPQYVIIMGGINDASYSTPASTIMSNLQTMYTNAHNAGIKVIALTMTPWGGSAGYTDPNELTVEHVNKWILDTAINVDYRVNTYIALEDPDNLKHLRAAYDTGDHLHPNMAGQAVIGQTIYDNVSFTKNDNPVLKVARDITLDQDLTTGGSPNFKDMTVGTLWINGYTGTSYGIKQTSTYPNFLLGNTGLGTASPLTKVDISETASRTTFLGTAYSPLMVSNYGTTGNYSTMDFSVQQSNIGPIARIGALKTSSGSYLKFGTTNNYTSGITNSALTIGPYGKIGVLVDTPSAPFHIMSAISSEQIRIGYDNSNYAALRSGSTGQFYLTFSGSNPFLDIDTKVLNIGPLTNNTAYIGMRRNGSILGGFSTASSVFSLYGGATVANHLNITSSGNVGIGTSLTAPSDKLEVDGNINLKTAGNKIKIATGTNGSLNKSSAMVSGTITVSNTSVTSNSIILLTPIGPGTGQISLGTITAGTSFVINSSDNSDTRVVQYIILN